MDWLLIAARAVHFAATVSLAGLYAFRCFVAGPSLRGSPPTPTMEAALARRLLALAWASLLLALASGAAWLLLVASRMSGMALADALARGAAGVVLFQTQFGTDWLARLGLAALIAACLVAGQHGRARVMDWIALVAGAGFLGALAWAGHGGATEEGVPFDALHLPADILHLLAAGAWLGSLVPLAVLLALARSEGSATAAAVARGATLRFSTLGVISVAILLATGAANAWFLTGTVPALLGTVYGRLVLLKVALFATMVSVAAVNRYRLTPRIECAPGDVQGARAIRQLRRNALIEATIGLGVLAIVGMLGTEPPGLHTEPSWPLPFRIDLGALAAWRQGMLAAAAVLVMLSVVAAAIGVAAGQRRHAAAAAAGIVLGIFLGWASVRAAVEPAYPTSFYASTEPYAAPSVARGAPIYAANCATCHGETGHGDGPAAALLPIRPADLTEPHLFAHSVGDLFWWVGNGRANGVMPGFATVLRPEQRWDVINFILARAAGDLSRSIGPEPTTAAAPPMPDFAFERAGVQTTLAESVKTGPVLLLLYAPPAPSARFAALAEAAPRFAAAKLTLIAVATEPPGSEEAPVASPPPRFAAEASDDVRAMLALFETPSDGGETELMLDRGGSIRARWTAAGGGLADAATLAADAVRVASIPVAAPSHAGHAH
jgi:copper resistance protein D